MRRERDAAAREARAFSQRRLEAIAPLEAAARENWRTARKPIQTAGSDAASKSESRYRVAREIDSVNAALDCLREHASDPVERARMCQVLIEIVGVSQRDIAGRLGRDDAVIRHDLKLLFLPDWCQELLRRRAVTEDEYRTWLVTGGPPPEALLPISPA